MNGDIACPVDGCPFEAPIDDIASHLARSDDTAHEWHALGYDGAKDFCVTAHLKAGERLEANAQESEDKGNFDLATEQLEAARRHYRRVNQFEPDGDELDDLCSRIERKLLEVRDARRQYELDDLMDRAMGAIDDGDRLQIAADPEVADQTYRDAQHLFESAQAVAQDVSPEQVPAIEQYLQRVELRRRSLTPSERHQQVRARLTASRECLSAGDRAFKQANFETALAEYVAAVEHYTELIALLETFHFDGHIDDPTVCDVCRDRFDGEVRPELSGNADGLVVCPFCAQFGSGGSLPLLEEVETEHQVAVENVQALRDRDVGLDWTAPRWSESSEELPVDSESRTYDRTTMVVQLVGTVQTVGRVPTAVDLDEHTDFGYLAYVEEFGDIDSALEEAGFEIA